METSSHDVLLVGGGGAGLRAAIAIAETNPSLSVAVVSKVYPMRSHTVSAEGGAAAVIKATDSLFLSAVGQNLSYPNNSLLPTLVGGGVGYGTPDFSLDTNIDDHHHFFCESSGMLQDIPSELVSVSNLPPPPAGAEIRRVDVIIRIRQEARPTAAAD